MNVTTTGVGAGNF